MTSAQTIIEKFGGTRRCAAAVGKAPSTVQSWKDSGFIPARHQAMVLEAARSLGIELSPSDFIAVPAEAAQ